VNNQSLLSILCAQSHPWCRACSSAQLCNTTNYNFGASWLFWLLRLINTLTYLLTYNAVYYSANQAYRTVKRSWPAACNFGVVNTTDNDCEQQLPTVILCLQQLLTTRLRDDDLLRWQWPWWCQSWTAGRINISIIIKNECHSNIIVDRLQGCGHSIKLRERESRSSSRLTGAVSVAVSNWLFLLYTTTATYYNCRTDTTKNRFGKDWKTFLLWLHHKEQLMLKQSSLATFSCSYIQLFLLNFLLILKYSSVRSQSGSVREHVSSKCACE